MDTGRSVPGAPNQPAATPAAKLNLVDLVGASDDDTIGPTGQIPVPTAIPGAGLVHFQGTCAVYHHTSTSRPPAGAEAHHREL